MPGVVGDIDSNRPGENGTDRIDSCALREGILQRPPFLTLMLDHDPPCLDCPILTGFCPVRTGQKYQLADYREVVQDLLSRLVLKRKILCINHSVANPAMRCHG